MPIRKINACVCVAASRSTSPSSRGGQYGQQYTSAYRQTGTIPKKKSGIPRSLANSRETSPTRYIYKMAHLEAPPLISISNRSAIGTLKRNVYPTTGSPRRTDRPPLNPTARPVLAQKILQDSREAENALADALVRKTKSENIK